MIRIGLGAISAIVISMVLFKRLSKRMSPIFSWIISTSLALISLLPGGWLLPIIVLILAPSRPPLPSKLCAKCGTIHTKGEATCKHCKNSLN